jgi:hypothetical protein
MITTIILVVVVSATLVISCPDNHPRFIKCINETHYERRSQLTNELCDISSCRFSFKCHRTDHTCRANTLIEHTYRAVDYQLVSNIRADQLQHCTNHTTDVKNGFMLCDVWHATKVTKPTFGHLLGFTWLTLGSPFFCPGPASEWRKCVGRNLAIQVRALVAESPELLISGGLMEFIHKTNLDDPSLFPDKICRPGSIGCWGDNQTCAPDVTQPAIQDYYVAWGKEFLDAGIRAIFFGQARMTGGTAEDGTDGVSRKGGLGFAIVIDRLKEYARSKSYGQVYFGPQASASIIANGVNIADWVYGAQHLEPHSTFTYLTQPLLRNGSYIYPLYGPGDFHDANRLSATFGIPTILDYDNWTADEKIYDDIRFLAAWPNDQRPTLVKNHYRNLRLYNNLATVSIPISKWLAVPHQCRCYVKANPDWGYDNIYFSAYACGLISTITELFAAPFVNPIGNIERRYWGQQLQSTDDSAVWMYKSLLHRDIGDAAEYEIAMKDLKPRMYSATGPRCNRIKVIISSYEFDTRACPLKPTPRDGYKCIITSLYNAIMLKDPEPQQLNYLIDQFLAKKITKLNLTDALCEEADKEQLYAQTI